MLKGKTVVVGVCGGIAAYKAVEVVSRLRKLNADVHVVMTKHACEFVTPLTFQSLSHNLVVTDMFAEPKSWNVEHISLARKADLVVIVPATANIIGKVANGIADDMLTTTIMASKASVLFVPAMNSSMYENIIVQDNIRKLKKFGYNFMEPDVGIMAAEGEHGKGRLPEPQAIVRKIFIMLYPKKDLEGMRILITSGPTREPIDPVRYISNHSSGKMGYALAESACNRGAYVKVISGPVNIQNPVGVEVISVNSAQEMYDEVLNQYSDYNVLIMVAAVADYKCQNVFDKKIKKTDGNLKLELTKNPDIAKEIGNIKGDRILVGFSAETNDLLHNARVKLEEKNLDMIIANDVTAEGAGFGVDTNIVKIIKRDGKIKELPLLSKIEVAHEVLDELVNISKNRS